MSESKKIAFLFPGQGSQHVGMGKSFYDNFSYARARFEEASDQLHINFKTLLFDGPESELKLTKFTQPALLLVSTITHDAIQNETGVTPVYVAGHSLGEYSALVATSALKFSDAMHLVFKRGTYMQEAVSEGQGKMAALIGKDLEFAKSICADSGSEIANVNSENQIVISGKSENVDAAIQLTSSRGGKAILLNVSAPFHCSLMKPAEEKMKLELDPIVISPLTVPYIANVDSKIHSDPLAVKSNLLKQICSSVLWYQSIQLLLQMGITQFIEVGSLQVLTSLMKRINRDVSAKAINAPADLEFLNA